MSYARQQEADMLEAKRVREKNEAVRKTAVLRAHNSGLTPYEIRQRTGFADSVIRKCLKEANLEPHRRTPDSLTLRLQQMRRGKARRQGGRA